MVTGQNEGDAKRSCIFPPPTAEDGDAEPDSPEKFRPRVQAWLKGVPQGKNRNYFEKKLRRLTEAGDLNEDEKQLQKITGNLQQKSMQTTPQQRADYLANMACQHPNGKFILSKIISRLFNRDAVSAAVLSERLKDIDRCPAAKGLTADDWEYLVPCEEPALSKFRRVFRRYGVQRLQPKTGRKKPPASG